MTTSQPTSLSLNAPNPTVGASLLAMAANEPTNPVDAHHNLWELACQR